MPGIFGVVDASSQRSERQQQELVAIVQQMSASMLYEPRYIETLVSCPAAGACVGRVGSVDDGHFEKADEGYVIVVTTGDASSREAAVPYRAYDSDSPSRLTGISSGFVADRARGTCLLFTDRYGRERIFLHTDGTRTFFSSEAKAILAVAPKTRGFDPVGLAELLACGCTLGAHSLFRDIEVLEAGMLLTFDASGATRRRYFDRAELENLEPVSADDFLEGFSASLKATVDGFVRGGPKVGISLTGGLDSRMIMASLDAPPGSVPCYTFGSMYRTTGDVSVARKVAATCGQPHQVVELGQEFLASIRKNLEQAVHISDGYLGFSGAAELYVNRVASSIAPARMTGNWGGELMRGVRAFKYEVPGGDFVTPDLRTRMAESAAAFSTTSSNPLSAALFQQMPLQGYGRYAIERSQVVMRSPFLADDVVRWLYRAPASVRESAECARAVIARRPELLAIPTDLGLLGAGPTSVRLLRRLSRKAVIKAEYLTSHGAPNWLALLSARVPAPMIETAFLGVDKFQHFRPWIRRELSEFVEETLIHDSGGALDAWFDMHAVRGMVRSHIDGKANFTDEIDKLITLALAGRTLLKTEPPQPITTPARQVIVRAV